jgi:hypothetical protein
LAAVLVVAAIQVLQHQEVLAVVQQVVLHKAPLLVHLDKDMQVVEMGALHQVAVVEVLALLVVQVVLLAVEQVLTLIHLGLQQLHLA